MDVSDVSDEDVLVLIKQGKPISDLLKEYISLRRWKEQQLRLREQESQRMELLFSRLCVSSGDICMALTALHSTDLPIADELPGRGCTLGV